VSAASAWEIATKVRLGRLPAAERLAASMRDYLPAQGFVALDVTLDHALRAGSLAGAHRDPFDRMLIAQSLAEGMPLVSNEAAFDVFGVARVW
jgi:PIN domain nuclease of toxin-antitoxin system